MNTQTLIIFCNNFNLLTHKYVSHNRRTLVEQIRYTGMCVCVCVCVYNSRFTKHSSLYYL